MGFYITDVYVFGLFFRQQLDNILSQFGWRLLTSFKLGFQKFSEKDI